MFTGFACVLILHSTLWKAGRKLHKIVSMINARKILRNSNQRMHFQRQGFDPPSKN